LRTGDDPVNQYSYSGKNLKNGSSIYIGSAPYTSGKEQRQIYTWRKNKYRYQIVYRTSEPKVIRLQVFTPNGKEILNRLLTN
jgi:Uri superfamily endonuclease